MSQYQAELLLANAILAANGVYQAPTFGPVNTPTQNGSYYSLRSYTSAGYYDSSQVWSGAASIIMEGDPIIGTMYGRNNLDGGRGHDVLWGSTGNYTSANGKEGNDLIIANQQLYGYGGEGNDVLAAGIYINSSTSGNYLPLWQSILVNANSLSPEALHKLFSFGGGASQLVGENGNDILIALSNDAPHLSG